MVGGFVVVWLIFVAYGEVMIAHERRRGAAQNLRDGGGTDA